MPGYKIVRTTLFKASSPEVSKDNPVITKGRVGQEGKEELATRSTKIGLDTRILDRLQDIRC